MRRGTTSGGLWAAAAVVVLSAGLVPGSASATGQGHPHIWKASSRPYGTSYDEWTARWWQWAYSIPASVNPLRDESGADCGQGQDGKVFYLAGVLNVTGTAHRTCSVPAGRALFFPIINAEWDNYLCTDPDANLTAAELRDAVTGIIDGATDLRASIDGEEVDVSHFRFASPLFDITVPDNGLCDDEPKAGTFGPAVGDGYYLMVKPLSAGHHTVAFSGSLPAFNFSLDISYDLEVARATRG